MLRNFSRKQRTHVFRHIHIDESRYYRDEFCESGLVKRVVRFLREQIISKDRSRELYMDLYRVQSPGELGVLAFGSAVARGEHV